MSGLVPSELRSHIAGYVPVDQTGLVASSFELDPRDLIRELRELGIVPEELIARERLRQQYIRELEATPSGRLYRVLAERTDQEERRYEYTITTAHDLLYIDTRDLELARDLRQLGYEADALHAWTDEWTIRVRDPNLLRGEEAYDKLYRDIIRLDEAVKGPQTHVDEVVYELR